MALVSEREKPRGESEIGEIGDLPNSKRPVSSPRHHKSRALPLDPVSRLFLVSIFLLRDFSPLLPPLLLISQISTRISTWGSFAQQMDGEFFRHESPTPHMLHTPLVDNGRGGCSDPSLAFSNLSLPDLPRSEGPTGRGKLTKRTD